MDDLTNEQKRLLVSMYKEVLSRQPAKSFRDANYFSSSDEVRDLFFPQSHSDDISDLCWELEGKGYILCFPGDDLANDIRLTDQSIVCLENRFKNKMSAIVDFLLRLRP